MLCSTSRERRFTVQIPQPQPRDLSLIARSVPVSPRVPVPPAYLSRAACVARAACLSRAARRPRSVWMYRKVPYTGCSTIGSEIDWTTTCGVATDLQSRILRPGGARLRFSNSPYCAPIGTFIPGERAPGGWRVGRCVTPVSPAPPAPASPVRWPLGAPASACPRAFRRAPTPV